jgi:hypothetical protein
MRYLNAYLLCEAAVMLAALALVAAATAVADRGRRRSLVAAGGAVAIAAAVTLAPLAIVPARITSRSRARFPGRRLTW